MTFTPDTVVAEAIRTDPGVIDRLVALDPVFRKLRNPVLRKVMARLVTFREAARVAGVPLEQIMAAVNGAPIPAADSGEKTEAEPADREPRPDWMSGYDEDRARALDVRPVLAAGEEPLSEVMRVAAKVSDGDFLVLDAPFDPAPLRRVLAGKGFVSWAECLTTDHWRVYFKRDSALAASAEAETAAEREAEGARVWREDGVAHIDVRGLEPPRPMRAIVTLIEDPETGDAVVVHHEREPVFLYPELAERGWAHEIVAGEAGEVRLRLSKEART